MPWLYISRVKLDEKRQNYLTLNKTKNIRKFIRYILFLLSFFFFPIGWIFENFNIMLLSVVLLYIQGVLYCAENIRKRIYVFVFYITIYVFLLSRPTIAWMNQEIWWKKKSVEGMKFALFSLLLTMLFLQAGALFVEQCENVEKKEKKQRDKIKFTRNLQIISKIIFYISILFYFVIELEKLFYMRGKMYVEYYVSFQSVMPGIIHLIASFMVYSLCVFLATLPQKKNAVVPLGLYFLSAVPSLMIGIRNPIMLRALFILLYFLMRDFIENKRKWVGRLEKIVLIIMIPVTLVFMSVYSSWRSGETVGETAMGELFVDFFYKQGVTFNVLAIGYDSIPYLPNRQFRNYTFGGFLDSILHGRVAQRFFGAEALDGGNNINNALLSNRFAHNMSYVAKGEKYLEGEGWGSSYLLETYTDYGYLGIIIFSFILGAVLIWGISIWKKNTLVLTIWLATLTQLFFMPRSGATECIEFLLAPSFWALIALCYIGAGLCCKSYEGKEKIKYV